jgi:hypothetical protein
MMVTRVNVEHLLTTLACLFKYTQDSGHQQRLTNKFLENDFEKLHLLLVKRLHYSIIEGESYIEKLDNGLIQLQMIDVILIHLIDWSDEILKALPSFLKELEFEPRAVLENVKGNLS